MPVLVVTLVSPKKDIFFIATFRLVSLILTCIAQMQKTCMYCKSTSEKYKYLHTIVFINNIVQKYFWLDSNLIRIRSLPLLPIFYRLFYSSTWRLQNSRWKMGSKGRDLILIRLDWVVSSFTLSHLFSSSIDKKICKWPTHRLKCHEKMHGSTFC